MKTIYKTTILATGLILMGLPSIINAQNHIAAGGWHSLVICNDSTVKAFGENATGELGNGLTTDSNIPVTVTGLTGMVDVSAGGDQLEAHSLALKSNGTVWAWGSNIYGGLGNGSTISTTSPVQVLILTGIIKISAGGWHSVALKNDGTVWAWGWNTDGQLGDGTVVDKTVPAQIPGLSGIVKIAAGTYHVMALKNDGTVWTWGDNVSGQIGDGTTVDRITPYQVSGLNGIVAITAGRFFSLAVKNDGTVWTWGENLYGQLGDGTLINKSTPIQVTGLSGITSAVAATGAFHCMALKNDNTVWAWGRNTYGNIGDGSLTNRSTPVQMSGISNVAGLAAGTNFSLIYKTDGTFWGCGRNLSGQLGDGTTSQKNTPSQSLGVCSIIQPVGIKENPVFTFADIKSFPNPSSDGKFKIEMTDNSNDFKECKIEIYNSIGQILTSLNVNTVITNQRISIDLSNQDNGVYYIAISKGQHKVYQKLMKY